MTKKISLPLEAPKNLIGEQARNWYRARNFVVCPVILITTVNSESTVNVAVKTNFMTVGSMTRYAFHCSPQHHTYQNVVETKEFVINVPIEDIISRVLKAAILTEKPCPNGLNEIERAELTPIPSEKVRPPRIKECVAHYECVLDWHKDGLIVGKVVAVSVDKSLIDKTDSRKMVVVGGGRTPNSYGIASETKKWPRIDL
ncbi:MAG: flavin reductase family protein [Candidatus Bathyarchaeota archaeon]|nr:flavin reductase family protein [Candidatus Bathyarchaeota archaeon]